MRILIVEDEKPAYTRLSKMILEQLPDASISDQVGSLTELSDYLSSQPTPDLAFLDIQLSDGSTLDYLEENSLEFPVIFATAYSEHALEVFDAMSIDYLLKPVKKEELSDAIQNYQKLKLFFSAAAAPKTNTQEYKSRFRVRLGQNILSIDVEDVAYFFSQNKVVLAQMIDGPKYPLDLNLETLETMLDPKTFFRINRQYIISLGSIESMKSYTKSRVLVTLRPPTDEPVVVSSGRSRDFKQWLDGK